MHNLIKKASIVLVFLLLLPLAFGAEIEYCKPLSITEDFILKLSFTEQMSATEPVELNKRLHIDEVSLTNTGNCYLNLSTIDVWLENSDSGKRVALLQEPATNQILEPKREDYTLGPLKDNIQLTQEGTWRLKAQLSNRIFEDKPNILFITNTEEDYIYVMNAAEIETNKMTEASLNVEQISLIITIGTIVYGFFLTLVLNLVNNNRDRIAKLNREMGAINFLIIELNRNKVYSQNLVKQKIFDAHGFITFGLENLLRQAVELPADLIDRIISLYEKIKSINKDLIELERTEQESKTKGIADLAKNIEKNIELVVKDLHKSIVFKEKQIKWGRFAKLGEKDLEPKKQK